MQDYSSHTKPVQIRGLRPEERANARKRAREQIIAARLGERPRREQFERDAQREFPAWLMTFSTVMLVIVLLAAAGMSSYRVARAGYLAFYADVHSGFLATVAAVSTALLAEFTIITATMVGQILLGKSRLRALLAIPITFGVLITVLGNAYITRPQFGRLFANDVEAWWGALETLAPPAVNIITAWLLKYLALAAVAERRAADLSFRQALERWEQLSASPEEMEGWTGFWARSIRDEIIRVNARGRNAAEKRTYLQNLKPKEWEALIVAEMQADAMFDDLSVSSGRRTLRTLRTTSERPDIGHVGQAGRVGRPVQRPSVRTSDMSDGSDASYSVRTPSSYRTDTRTAVFQFLDANPDLALEGIRTIADMMTEVEGRAFAHSTIGPYVKEWREQHRAAQGNGHNLHSLGENNG